MKNDVKTQIQICHCWDGSEDIHMKNTKRNQHIVISMLDQSFFRESWILNFLDSKWKWKGTNENTRQLLHILTLSVFRQLLFEFPWNGVSCRRKATAPCSYHIRGLGGPRSILDVMEKRFLGRLSSIYFCVVRSSRNCKNVCLTDGALGTQL